MNREISDTIVHDAAVSGYVRSGFEPVRDAFIENFETRDEIGAACCIYYRGEKVVDLWGGVRNKATGEPWESDTMVIVFSTTKGLSALAMALARSRGLFDYNDSVATYWPEFAQEGKERITIRQLLAHQAGLFAFDELNDRKIISDPDRLADVLARQKPAWPPGTRQAYHAISLGYYESELLRRVDPEHRSIGQFFQDEIATPLGLDFYIRLPEDIPNSRLAVLEQVNPLTTLFTMPIALYLAALNAHSNIRRALEGSQLPLDRQKIYARNLEVPAGGGVGTARSIAHAYSAAALGGEEMGLSKSTLSELMAPPVAPVHGFHDAALKVDVRFSLGFAKPGPGDRYGHPTAFGHPGAGGSFGFADPMYQIGYAYVPNHMGGYLIDPRDAGLRGAMYRCIGVEDPYVAGQQVSTAA